MKRRPIQRQSDKARRIATERAALRFQLVEDRGPICQRCQAVYWSEMHEISPRSAGGSPTDPDNIATLCSPCHKWVHANPKQALAEGWKRSRYD